MPAPVRFVSLACQARPQPQDHLDYSPHASSLSRCLAAYSAVVALEACSLLLVA
jgi:hypothetical protein